MIMVTSEEFWISERNRSSLSRTAASASSFCSMVAPAIRMMKKRTNTPMMERAVAWAKERRDGSQPCQMPSSPTRHADEAPQGDRAPRPRPAPGDVRQGHEGVGPPQHRTPAGQVDHRGDGGDLDGDPQVEGDRDGCRRRRGRRRGWTTGTATKIPSQSQADTCTM